MISTQLQILNAASPSLDVKSASLFHDSQAGILISGDSGFGKSNAMKVLMQRLACCGAGFLFISPHGEDPLDLYQWCVSQGGDIAARTVYIDLADTSRQCSINPLAVPHSDDPIKRQAQLYSKVGHVARILIAAWGEEDFNNKPRLFTWTYRILSTLARLGLPFADAKHFLDIGSSEYNALAQSVPDLLDRHAFENLGASSIRDQNEQIESTRNRLLGFFSNPIVETLLGRTENVVDIGRLRRNGAIVIVNVRRGGVLREEDQQIIANLFLAEHLHDVFNSDTAIPHFTFLDELPVFARGSGPELTSAQGQIRKFGERFVYGMQGGNPFPDRYDDPLLHACIGQCGLHFLFRHKNPTDAKFFGEIIGLPSYDPMRIKHELKQQQQYQDGYDIIELVDINESITEQRSSGGSRGQTVTEGEQWGSSSSQTSGSSSNFGSSLSTTNGKSQNIESVQEQQLRQAINQARGSSFGMSDSMSSGSSSSHGSSRSTSFQESANWSQMQGFTIGRSRKKTLVPRIKWRTVTTSVTFFTPEEHMLRHASLLSSLPIGEAVVNGLGNPFRARFPLAASPARRAPRLTAVQVRKHLSIPSPYFASAEDILTERQQFLQRLFAELGTLPPDSDPGDDPFSQ